MIWLIQNKKLILRGECVGVFGALIFLLSMFAIGALLMKKFYDKTYLGIDIRWLIGALMVGISIFHLLIFVSNVLSVLCKKL